VVNRRDSIYESDLKKVEIIFVWQHFQVTGGDASALAIEKGVDTSPEISQIRTNPLAWNIDTGKWEKVFLLKPKTIDRFCNAYNYIINGPIDKNRDFKPMGKIIMYYTDGHRVTSYFDGTCIKINNEYQHYRDMNKYSFFELLLDKPGTGDSIIDDGKLLETPKNWYLYPGNMCDVPPTFPEGLNWLINYFNSQKINYVTNINPKNYGAIREEFIQFEIDTLGKIINSWIVGAGVSSAIDSNFLKAVNNMPNWTPGILIGKKVNTVAGLSFYTKLKYTKNTFILETN
jgi:hypothetical protein